MCRWPTRPRFFLVYADEGGTTQAYIVPADTPGVKVGKRVKLMGMQALELFEVEFENVRVPKANRLGGLKGIRIQKLLTLSRITLAALAVGQARAAYEYAVDYAKTRWPLASRSPTARASPSCWPTCVSRSKAHALMVWEAAYKFDNDEDATKAAYLAKQYADKMVLEVTDGAVQVLGGHGYVRDHPVELWLRNGRGFATLDGTVIG